MYAAIEVVKTALEFANIVAAVVLLWSLQMPLRPKLTVVTAFALRLLYAPTQPCSLDQEKADTC